MDIISKSGCRIKLYWVYCNENIGKRHLDSEENDYAKYSHDTNNRNPIYKYNVTHYYLLWISMSKNTLCNFNMTLYKFITKREVTKVIVNDQLYSLSLFNYVFLRINNKFIYSF